MPLINLTDDEIEQRDHYSFVLNSPYNQQTVNNWHERLDLLFGLDWTGTCVAGGFAACRALGISAPLDLDFFFYGTEHEFNAKRTITFLLDKIREQPETYGFIKLETSKNVFRVKSAFNYSIDFIFIKYPTMESILESFDLDCCRFGFDKNGLWTTKSGLNVLKTRSMNIDLFRATTSLCKRIVKYYKRGIGIRIPDTAVRAEIRRGNSFSIWNGMLTFQFHYFTHQDSKKWYERIASDVHPGYVLTSGFAPSSFYSGFEKCSEFKSPEWKIPDFEQGKPTAAMFNPVKVTDSEFWAIQPITIVGTYYTDPESV